VDSIDAQRPELLHHASQMFLGPDREQQLVFEPALARSADRSKVPPPSPGLLRGLRHRRIEHRGERDTVADRCSGSLGQSPQVSEALSRIEVRWVEGRQPVPDHMHEVDAIGDLGRAPDQARTQGSGKVSLWAMRVV
jgi:hypothetical protein